jgi:hypothetical protein
MFIGTTTGNTISGIASATGHDASTVVALLLYVLLPYHCYNYIQDN